MPDHPIRAGKLDLDPEFASQWGIEPEDAFTMLVTSHQQAGVTSKDLALRRWRRGDVSGGDSRRLPSPACQPRPC